MLACCVQPIIWNLLACVCICAHATSAGQRGASAVPKDAGQKAVTAPGDSVSELIAPAPNFKQPVDYVAWVKGGCELRGKPNAWDVYASVLEIPGDARTKAKWPEQVDDLYNGKHPGPPAPWDPKQHPEWERSRVRMQPFLSMLQQASRVEACAMPLFLNPGQGGPEAGPLLTGAALPTLNQHRVMLRAALADAWRAEGGRLNAARLLKGVETCLRCSGHMLQGDTIMHRLVGLAERNLIEASVRHALARQELPVAQLEKLLDLLREFDRPAPNPAGWVRRESATVLEIVQATFTPAGPDGRPQLNHDRVALLLAMDAQSNSEALASMTPESAQRSVDAIRGAYREMAAAWQIGYPQMRLLHVRADLDRHARTTPLTKILLTGLAPVYQFSARHDAGLRATQLACAIHLHKAKSGRWPASLADLPVECAGIRVDPFSGHDFVYKLSSDGPTIYSVSENAKDDGGRHSAGWDNPESVRAAGGSDDFVFWPVQPK